MSNIEYIRNTYKVPARHGGRVRYTGSNTGEMFGTITGVHGGYLKIRMDGDKFPGTYHPVWQIEYLDEVSG